jgi:hypothetical protein
MSQVQQRSMFVTVVAWIFIALSGFGTVISTLQNIMVHTMFSSPEFDRALHGPTPGMPPAAAFLFGHFELFVFGVLVLSALLLVSSIGLLRRWNWARLCFVGLMVAAILWQLVGIGVQFSIFSTVRDQFAAASTAGGPDVGPFLIAIAVVSVLFGLGFSVLFGWIAKRLLSAPVAAEFRR